MKYVINSVFQLNLLTNLMGRMDNNDLEFSERSHCIISLACHF